MKFFLSTKEMNPITRKNIPKLEIKPGFRDVHQKPAEWETLENTKIRDKCKAVSLSAIHLSRIFGVFKCPPLRVYLACFLKLACVDNCDMRFVVIGIIYLVDGSKVMLINIAAVFVFFVCFCIRFAAPIQLFTVAKEEPYYK